MFVLYHARVEKSIMLAFNSQLSKPVHSNSKLHTPENSLLLIHTIISALQIHYTKTVDSFFTLMNRRPLLCNSHSKTEGRTDGISK